MTQPPFVDGIGKHAVFLDFDGTLVDIAATPDAVIVPPGLPDLLDRMHRASAGAVALVSGRDIATLRQFLPGFKGVLIGSHGAESHPHLPGLSPVIGSSAQTEIVGALHAATQGHDGYLIEAKPHGATLHFRANPGLEPDAHKLVKQVAQDFPGYHVQSAKMALELVPRGISKERALAHLMGNPPFSGRIPIYAGDDVTDEGALTLATATGGFGIAIGTRPSAAPYHLDRPSDLLRWLNMSLIRGVD